MRARITTDDERGPAPARRDGGFSLVEIVVAVALLGLTITAVLGSLRVTIRASSIDRDHAVAFAWLQAASDQIYQDPRVPCTSGRPAAIAAYRAAAQAVARPPVWDATSATIDVIDVEYLGRSSPNAVFEWSASYCFEGGIYSSSPLYTQRVTIQATSPNGNIVETLEMVKSE